MVDSSDPAAINPALGAGQGGGRDQGRRRTGPPPKPAPRPPRGEGEISDLTTTMGIPPEEVTQRVQKGLIVLLHEVDRQREELDHLRAHLAFLEAEADRHAHLPIPNRRAFHRELSRLLTMGERAETISSLAAVVLRNFDQIRWSEGRRAAEEALAYLAERLRSRMQPGDFLASLGGNDLGLVLALAQESEATARLAQAVTDPASLPFRWQGRTIALDVAFGVKSFGAGDTVDGAIEAADLALRTASATRA